MHNKTFSVLVLDDDPGVANTVRACLRPTGWNVTATTSVREAVTIATESAPNVFICDAVMPKYSGAQVIHALKSDPATAGIPIVLMTGYCDAGVYSHLPWDGFLSKPFGPQEIREAIESAVRACAKQTSGA